MDLLKNSGKRLSLLEKINNNRKKNIWEMEWRSSEHNRKQNRAVNTANVRLEMGTAVVSFAWCNCTNSSVLTHQ